MRADREFRRDWQPPIKPLNGPLLLVVFALLCWLLGLAYLIGRALMAIWLGVEL